MAYTEGDGIWRTIRGRRVFLENSKSLYASMVRSGKFPDMKRPGAAANRPENVLNGIGNETNAAGLDNSQKDGILNAGAAEDTSENQRYGRDKSALVNKTYIDSGEYRNKFDKITKNKEVNRILYAKAKEMLRHRSGSTLEDMCWVDMDTGEIVASTSDQEKAEIIIYTKAIKNAIAGRTNLIAMHTHPHSMPPSDSDFNSAYDHGYAMGLVFCHNGKIFQYTAGEKISSRIYNMYIQNFVEDGNTEYEAQINALKKISRDHNIDFWEVT